MVATRGSGRNEADGNDPGWCAGLESGRDGVKTV